MNAIQGDYIGLLNDPHVRHRARRFAGGATEELLMHLPILQEHGTIRQSRGYYDSWSITIGGTTYHVRSTRKPGAKPDDTLYLRQARAPHFVYAELRSRKDVREWVRKVTS
jgi:hypothetical protein